MGTDKTQKEARQLIVKTAWEHRLKGKRTLKALTVRNINECVAICRRNMLLDGSVFLAAGFNAVER